MDRRIPAFWESLRKKNVSVIGLGITNNDLIRLMLQKGIPVTIYDRKERTQIGELADELEGLGARLVLGPDHLKQLSGDVIFRAPGVYFGRPEITRARENGAAVTSEMEVFLELCPCPVIAVTGSDGKTTTTTLIAEMLRAAGYTVHIGGNIGRALLPEIEKIHPEDYAVLELSSFQLISMRSSPDVAVVTNVTPNHLDVHGSMEEYIAAKENILRHQNGFSRAVLNAENTIARDFAPLVRGTLCEFSGEKPVRRGAWLDADGVLWYRDGGDPVRFLSAEEIRIPGRHNVENMLAAACAVWGTVPPETIRRVAREFGGVEHRIELVRELDGVRWYNDSIATSPTRAIAGLRCFDQKIIMIAGGYDKKIPFEPLAPVILERVKTLILTGATADKIEAAVKTEPAYPESALEIIRVDSLEEAVQMARKLAAAGDVVSLSPACASFDRYPNFEIRGKHFKELVNAL